MAENPSVESIFFSALQKETLEERAAHLDQACGDNAELRRELERLLAAHPQLGKFLEQPAGGTGPFTPSAAPAPALALGSMVAGKYKLRERLGEGGMGVVYVADQTHPVQRRVALKVIKAGLDSAAALARFEQERQALALMDHPHIAKVLDAGATDAGQPFFVMELVKGIPITTYCDGAKLTPTERLELFVPVCHAVQHAHQKGVIHRDLKPSNILIGLYDGQPVPKVIDFGVAKTVGPQLTEHSVYTEAGMMVGTLEYMAPEQAEMNNLDIDTRADIYALGVVLYELLAGSVPFPRKQLLEAGLAEMLRVIKEVEPPRPSTRLSSSGDLPALAAVRKLEPQRLTKLVRGDLDVIAMKCLEKERSRRYETANGLAADLQRYLADEPVLARPPSWTDRWDRWKRRHPRAVATYTTGKWLAVILAMLGAFAYHKSHEANVYKRMHRRSQDDSVARQLALSLMTDVLRVARGLPRETQDVLRAELDWQAAQIDQRHRSNARARELLHEQVARSYEELDEFARAETHWRQSIELGLPGDTDEPAGLFNVIHDNLATRRLALAKALVRQGKPAEAEEVLIAAREGLRQTDQLNRNRGWDLLGVSPDAIFVVLALSDIYVSSNRYGMAEAILLPAFTSALPAPGEGYSFEFSVKGTGLFGVLDFRRQAYTYRTPNGLRHQIADRLARLHEAWGKPDDAAKWRKEAEALKTPPP